MRLFILTLLVHTVVHATAISAPVHTTLVAGHTAALKAKKPLVLFLYQDRNVACQRLEREGLPAARGLDAVFAKQNASVDDAAGNVAKLLVNFKITMLPTVLVLACTEKGVTDKGRITGFKNTADFVGKLSALLNPTAAAPAAAGPAVAKPATHAVMLRNAGYTFRTDDRGIHRVAIKRGTRTWRVVVQPGTTRTWIYAPLIRKERLLRADPIRILRLLEKSWDFGEMHFEADGTMLKLSLALASKDLDQNKLSTAIELLLKNMAATEALWDVP